MRAIPEIETERLILKGFTLADAEDVFDYASNPNVLKQTTARTPRHLSETEDYVRSLVESPPGSFTWAMRLKAEPRVVGAIEFDLGDGRTGSIHYALAEDCWNKGLMTEACRAVLDWAFRRHPDLQVIQTNALESNMGSRRVLEKSGFVFQDIREDVWEKFEEPVRLAVYAMSRIG